MTDTDPDTGISHIPPIGMEHHQRRNKGTGKWYASIRMPHFIIKEHQDLFPELLEKMRNNPKATNYYQVFLALLPYQIKGTLTEEKKRNIMKACKVI